MPIDIDAEERDVVLLDTSTAVAFVVEDHEAHAATFAALEGRRLGMAGHAWFETHSVLTRLPAGLGRSSSDAIRLLTSNFGASRFLGEAESSRLGGVLAGLRISGGAVYDALVGAAARQHRKVLVSSDARHAPSTMAWA